MNKGNIMCVLRITEKRYILPNRLLSTIDGNVEFVHTFYFVVTSVNSVFVSHKIINNNDNFRIKCYSYSNISAIVCVFTLFY